jgi:hypothetical protein
MADLLHYLAAVMIEIAFNTTCGYLSSRSRSNILDVVYNRTN